MIGIALRIRTTVFEVALVTILDEGVRDADGRSTVGDAVGEFIDRLSFVETRQAEMVVWAVNGDVFFAMFGESSHEGLEVFLAAGFAHVFGGEIGVHAGAVPVAFDGFAVVFHVDAVFFAEAVENVAGGPHFIGALFRALAEDLEFPLTFGDLGVDALVVDAGVKADVEVFLDDLACDVADGFVAGAAVVGALRGGIAIRWEAEDFAILIEEVFLFEAEPCAGIVEDGGAAVGWVRGHAVRHHHLAHHEGAIFAGAVREDRDRLEHAVGATSFCLLGRATIEAPHWKLFESWEAGKFFDLGFAAEIWHGGVAVEPDVFQFVFGHDVGCIRYFSSCGCEYP